MSPAPPAETATPPTEVGPAEPVTTAQRRRRVDTPSVLQMEALECGAAALGIVLATYGKWVPLEELRVACGVSRDGSRADALARAARHYGLAAKGVRLDPPDLDLVALPLIAYWNFNHFVVVTGTSPRGVRLQDPAVGRRQVTWAEFDRAFTGVAIALEPGEHFEPSGRAPSAVHTLPRSALGRAPGTDALPPRRGRPARPRARGSRGGPHLRRPVPGRGRPLLAVDPGRRRRRGRHCPAGVHAAPATGAPAAVHQALGLDVEPVLRPRAGVARPLLRPALPGPGGQPGGSQRPDRPAPVEPALGHPPQRGDGGPLRGPDGRLRLAAHDHRRRSGRRQRRRRTLGRAQPAGRQRTGGADARCDGRDHGVGPHHDRDRQGDGRREPPVLPVGRPAGQARQCRA